MEKFEVYRGKHMIRWNVAFTRWPSTLRFQPPLGGQLSDKRWCFPSHGGAIWSNGVSDRMPEISKLSIETNTIMKNVGPISPGILYVCKYNIYIYNLQEPLGGSSIQSKFLMTLISPSCWPETNLGGYPKPSLCKTPSSKKAKPNVHIFGPSYPLVNQL